MVCSVGFAIPCDPRRTDYGKPLRMIAINNSMFIRA